MSSKNVASLLLILLFLSSLTWAEEDSWTLPETITLLCSDSILKWCDGRKVRYLQTPPPGYKLCGEIAAQKLCNPSGRRFISPGSTPPNQVYKDCALGERIIVERIDLIEPGEQFNPQISEPMSEKEHVEAEKRLNDLSRHQSQSVALDLQGLSDELMKAVQAMQGIRR